MVRIHVFLLLLLPQLLSAQGPFAPQAGEAGTTAIPKDSTCFRDWAISCDVTRGLREMGVQDSGFADAGAPVYGTGKADAPRTVSLGDGGFAILTFNAPIYDGEGPDFAVFENGFGGGSEAFLEFAFVEVSSDGVFFARFPSLSEVQSNAQKAAFDNTDATEVHNLAGKYVAHFGVPFDLTDLPDTTSLDKQKITHIKVIDVVGSIDTEHARHDSEGKVINDPWPTNFGSGGFDLDAVGVINSLIPLGLQDKRSGAGDEPLYYDILGRPTQQRQGMIIGENGFKAWFGQ